MKRVIIILSLVMLIFVFNKKDESLIIPADSIRIRVVANSNSNSNIAEKECVKENLQNELFDLLKDSTSIVESRTILNRNLKNINNNVEKSLNMMNVDYGFVTNYGLNYFPEKNYLGVKYKEGYYESLVVTLGKGEGNNWWCVLFPPLCLIEAEEKETDKVEYKSLIKKVIDEYFK